MMDTLNSYRISDFVMYSSEVLDAVIAQYNDDIWPIQILCLFLAIDILFFLFKYKGINKSKVITSILVLAWGWVGVSFHLNYFTSINWAAKYFAYLFLTQAFLLCFMGLVLNALQFNFQPRALQIMGLAVFIGSSFVPVRLFFGSDLSLVVLFGWGAAPTAAATLGLLLNTKYNSKNLVLFVIPTFWLIAEVIIL